MSTQDQSRSGIIAWFARNPVAANLLMLIIITVGLGSAFSIQRAIFPAFDFQVIFINIPYPGAAPEEVEQGLIMKVEEAINDLDGIKRIESDSLESFGRVIIEPQDGVPIARLYNDVQNRIDGISTFPADAEEPILIQPDLLFAAVTIQISGALDERSMKALADEVRRELLTFPEVSSATVVGARDYEISVEISEPLLREYHLTLAEVANTISVSSLDLPSGSVQTRNGDIMLRTLGQAYVQQDFENIVLKTWPDGTRLMLGDIATVRDGFVDGSGYASFNGEYSLGINVFSMGKQDIVETARIAKDYVAQKQASLPDGVKLDIWADTTYYLEERLGMMVKNLAVGALLVFITLALFLEIKLAFWVMIGIPVCFLGAMAIINTPYIDSSLNMISLFGFILVLGIVVDDAIIMGESAYSETEAHGHSVNNVINGVYRVATPATFGVLTTIVAFTPTLFVQGVFAPMPAAMGWVVILCLVFSLIESKWILPAHLAHSRPTKNPILLSIDNVQEKVNARLRHFIDNRYRPTVERCVANRYVTLASFLAVFILCAGLVLGGVVRTVISPHTPGEFVQVELSMRDGTPEERTVEAVQTIVATLHEVDREYRRKNNTDAGLVAHVGAFAYDDTEGRIDIELTKQDTRKLSNEEVISRVRDKLGIIHGADVLGFQSSDGPNFGPEVSFDLMHPDFNALRKASEELVEHLRKYDGLSDIRNGAADTREEFHIDLLPEGEALGLTRYELGSQVRHAFYGAEAQRIQRGIDEIKVMVRYPIADRETVASLDNMYIRTPSGDEVPFDTVAQINTREGLQKITRINFRRAAEVTAEADTTIVEPAKVMSEVISDVLPELAQKYPGLTWDKSGLADEETKMVTSMLIGFALSMFGIYALLAIPTKSYLQPLIIMGVIPFGMIGAVVGHWIFGHAISMMSLMGIIALSGVVVNDSLILVDYVNKAVAQGRDKYQAIIEAGCRRFRAIMLTSMTTFLGLFPMLLERSAQAQFMVPMAISLAVGIVFATVITLLLVPSLYMILDDLGRLFSDADESPAAAETA
ncbi:acriflavin resistance protein [Halioglobus japonicus]|uniref:AcrB/AcrD/AcrF family protein n=1 Tax=Halioglobus japonicus TaxID=930805 RepID=A0AAP8MG03_9GAMM|nr:efflux RND transporter permease subunit [Halioglobus japonicus]AQA19844.1 acriflavin resistance protein [Halioglobus japonicus]PLW87080.1 AcrB/AcrD/AcrF family protein [Halioglobus japonicus]GHD10306.1 acriflavin resistance protein [Halioglobus japonicus]